MSDTCACGRPPACPSGWCGQCEWGPLPQARAVAPVPDPRDARIAELESRVTKLAGALLCTFCPPHPCSRMSRLAPLTTHDGLPCRCPTCSLYVGVSLLPQR